MAGEVGATRGAIQTCWCPRPPELCAAGGLSPPLTLDELGKESGRQLAREEPSCSEAPMAQQSSVSALGSAASCPQNLSGTPALHLAQAPISL